MRVDAKPGEIMALVVVTLMSFAANLPEQYLAGLMDRRILLLGLTVTVVIALFRYLRFLMFMAVVILAIGANLPNQLAAGLGVDPTALVVTLGVMVVFSLINLVVKVVPTGFEKQNNLIDTPDSRERIMSAVAKGDVVQLQKVLALGVEVNFQQSGVVPLLLAVDLGYSDIVQLLLQHGARFDVRNESGKSATDIAMEKGFTRCAQMLIYAAEVASGKPAKA